MVGGWLAWPELDMLEMVSISFCYTFYHRNHNNMFVFVALVIELCLVPNIHLEVMPREEEEE